MGLSNGYAQMPWLLIFSILLTLNGLILGHVWIAALSAFVWGFSSQSERWALSGNDRQPLKGDERCIASCLQWF